MATALPLSLSLSASSVDWLVGLRGYKLNCSSLQRFIAAAIARYYAPYATMIRPAEGSFCASAKIDKPEVMTGKMEKLRRREKER